jgi:hypothetical protein
LRSCGVFNRLRLADADLANLGNPHLAAANLDPLRNAEPGLIPLPALASGKPRPLLEEVPVGPLKIGPRLLHGLRIHVLKPRSFRLLLQRCEP